MLDDVMRKLELIQAQLIRIEGKVDAGRMVGASAGPAVDVDEKLIEGKYGDPIVRWMPKFWKGEDCKGRAYSTCPPELLDMVSKSLEWCAANPKPGKEEYAKNDKRDACRARTWAARIRASGGCVAKNATPAPKGAPSQLDLGEDPGAEPSPFGDDSDLPF